MNLCRTIALLLLLSGLAVAAVDADEAAIRKFVSEYVDAFNKQDLDSVSAMWAEKGTHADRETGVRTEGRAGILADLAEVFKGPAKTLLAGTVERVRLIKPDVARVEGTTTTSVPDEDPSVSQFTAILVKHGDDWQIDLIEETPVPQSATAYDALRELDWLVGTWVDESKDLPVVSTLRWSENGSFLIRSFSTGSGEQVATADVFAQSAAALATVPPPEDEQQAAEVEWMPLGTFAVAADEKDLDPSRVVQLAVRSSPWLGKSRLMSRLSR